MLPNRRIEFPCVLLERPRRAHGLRALRLQDDQVPAPLLDPPQRPPALPVLLERYPAAARKLYVQRRRGAFRAGYLFENPRHLIEVAQAVADDENVLRARRNGGGVRDHAPPVLPFGACGVP